MTIRNGYNKDCIKIGEILKSHRMDLTDISKNRMDFISDREMKFFMAEGFISEKTLMNYELGKNTPTLSNLKKLAIALEVDFLKLVEELMPYL
ncbi:helix-turn-helix domain-containing protein [Pseudolactococcus yaeyamensis]